MGKLRYILILLIVLAIAFFTRWLLTSVEEPISRQRGALRHDPDYFLTNLSSTVYEKEGRPIYKFSAAHLEHFPDDDTLQVRELEILYSNVNRGGENWLARADRGTIYENIHVLQLNDNVVIKNETTEAVKQVTITTDALRIDFNRRQGNTDAKVNIQGKNSNITATGMNINLETGILTLQSQVSGHYETR